MTRAPVLDRAGRLGARARRCVVGHPARAGLGPVERALPRRRRSGSPRCCGVDAGVLAGADPAAPVLPAAGICCRWPASTTRTSTTRTRSSQYTRMPVVDALITGNWAVLRSALSHLVLPALVIAAYPLGVIARMVRALRARHPGRGSRADGARARVPRALGVRPVRAEARAGAGGLAWWRWCSPTRW